MTVPSETKVEVKESDAKIAEAKPKTQEISPSPLVTNDASKPPEETQEQINWRKFRQEREKERKEKAEADRKLVEREKEVAALKAVVESVVNKPSPVVVDEMEETEEQRIQKKVDEAFEKKQRQFDVDRQKREAQELPQRLSSTFNDFNQICSQENLDYLEYHYPEVWSGFKNSSGNFEVWTGLYKTIKRLVPNTDTRKEVAKMEKNLSKPQSMSTPGLSQTGDHAPTDLTEKRRQDNWERMRKAMRSV